MKKTAAERGSEEMCWIVCVCVLRVCSECVCASCVLRVCLVCAKGSQSSTHEALEARASMRRSQGRMGSQCVAICGGYIAALQHSHKLPPDACTHCD